MKTFEDIEKEVNFRKEWIENYKLKYPSYYHIESYIAKLYEVIKNYKGKTEDAQNNLVMIKHKADILNADLAGELKSDSKKRLVRYRTKWINYHEAIDNIQKQFLDIVKKDLS
ncbi:hypothetical protein [Flavobacterium seoulense]|uniref:Uncharacterized protein n=1 Tax=Flavobacterium seoulense TaxID=1492738 RepID=A0A066WQX0_9FLAO|nr:hypothetical protein [Flavobacterium seoulense]KDN56442.1 hypothetical protein FEM21_04610 [Flavobacterium seoulense]